LAHDAGYSSEHTEPRGGSWPVARASSDNTHAALSKADARRARPRGRIVPGVTDGVTTAC
jgi:hypothetical protein